MMTSVAKGESRRERRGNKNGGRLTCQCWSSQDHASATAVRKAVLVFESRAAILAFKNTMKNHIAGCGIAMFECADIRCRTPCARESSAAFVRGGQVGNAPCSGIQRRTGRLQGHGLHQAAVALQRAQKWVGSHCRKRHRVIVMEAHDDAVAVGAHRCGCDVGRAAADRGR